MPIPALTNEGLLPAGVHDCTLDEIKLTFGPYGHRRSLFLRLVEYVEAAVRSGIVDEIIVDGSFVTSVLEPGDIDLAVAIRERPAAGLLRPLEYNVVSRRQVAKRYKFDILAAPAASPEYLAHIEFFSQVKNRPGVIKGVLRVTT